MQDRSSGFQWPAQWTPDILATLMFVVQDGKILLIRKKRGIGAGKVNGPGGKFEPGETALQCVLREVREELCIDVADAREMGVLNFSFTCGTIPEIRCHVFMASSSRAPLRKRRRQSLSGARWTGFPTISCGRMTGSGFPPCWTGNGLRRFSRLRGTGCWSFP